MRLRHSQIPWSWSTSLHLPLVLPNVAFWSLKKQAPHAAGKIPKVRLCESQTQRPLVFAFSSDAPPCWWLGSADRGIFAKVPRKFCEGGPSKPFRKNCLISNSLSWKGDSVMPAACLQGYEEVIRDNMVWFGKWWTNLDKRSCCLTWVPQKINMEFAKDSRKTTDKGI